MSEEVTETVAERPAQDQTNGTKESPKRLYMMLFESTAGAKTRLRLGARHAMAVFIVAKSKEMAVARARKGLEMTGWSSIQFKHGVDITGQKRLKDKALDASAQKAIEKGAAFLIYKNEIKGQA